VRAEVALLRRQAVELRRAISNPTATFVFAVGLEEMASGVETPRCEIFPAGPVAYIRAESNAGAVEVEFGSGDSVWGMKLEVFCLIP
jgi:hypothetical protein